MFFELVIENAHIKCTQTDGTSDIHSNNVSTNKKLPETNIQKYRLVFSQQTEEEEEEEVDLISKKEKWKPQTA